MPDEKTPETENGPGKTEATPHKVDEKVQEQAAEERAENPGYD